MILQHVIADTTAHGPVLTLRVCNRSVNDTTDIFTKVSRFSLTCTYWLGTVTIKGNNLIHTCLEENKFSNRASKHFARSPNPMSELLPLQPANLSFMEPGTLPIPNCVLPPLSVSFRCRREERQARCRRQGQRHHRRHEGENEGQG